MWWILAFLLALGALGASRQAASAGAIAVVGAIAAAATAFAGLATLGLMFAQESGVEKVLESSWAFLAGVDDVRQLIPECTSNIDGGNLIWTLIAGLLWLIAFLLMAVVWISLIVGPVVTVGGGIHAVITRRAVWLNRGLLILVCGLGGLIVSGLLMRLTQAVWLGLAC
jgi:hypothetical protein